MITKVINVLIFFSECRWDHQYSSGGEFFKVVFINVCGLLSKFNVPDFIDFISEYDLICICESKFDDADVHNVDLDGYQFIPHNRKKSLRKAGGIGIFVKNELIDNSYISFPKNDVENITFLAATKQLNEWYFLSVCPSVRPSVTPFSLCSHHRIIMKFSGVITNDQGKVHTKGQGHRDHNPTEPFPDSNSSSNSHMMMK